jgi:hypothetical protein
MKTKLAQTATVLLILALGSLFPRGMVCQDSSQKLLEKYGLKPEDMVLPPGAIELEKVSSFPSAEDENRGIYLSSPGGFLVTPSGRIYIPDINNDEAYVFDLIGRYLFRFGRSGQGPGEFRQPTVIAQSDDQVVIEEMMNMRLQIFDSAGTYLRGARLFKTYHSMVLVDGLIYATPYLMLPPDEQKGANLIDVLDQQGRVLRSFGTPLEVDPFDFALLNHALLKVDAERNLWLAFQCFPLIRKYALDGRLLKEFSYQYAVVKKEEAFNKLITVKRFGVSQLPHYYVCGAIHPDNDGLYIFTSVHTSAESRLDIYFIKDGGQIAEFYWQPRNEGILSWGLYVHKEKNDKIFYLLESTPNPLVEIFKIKGEVK